MATKTITILEEAYDLLKKSKLPEESFSKEIIRLLRPKKEKKITDLAGAWKDMPEEEFMRIKEGIAEFRRGFKIK